MLPLSSIMLSYTNLTVSGPSSLPALLYMMNWMPISYSLSFFHFVISNGISEKVIYKSVLLQNYLGYFLLSFVSPEKSFTIRASLLKWLVIVWNVKAVSDKPSFNSSSFPALTTQTLTHTHKEFSVAWNTGINLIILLNSFIPQWPLPINFRTY